MKYLTIFAIRIYIYKKNTRLNTSRTNLMTLVVGISRATTTDG